MKLAEKHDERARMTGQPGKNSGRHGLVPCPLGLIVAAERASSLMTGHGSAELFKASRGLWIVRNKPPLFHGKGFVARKLSSHYWRCVESDDRNRLFSAPGKDALVGG